MNMVPVLIPEGNPSEATDQQLCQTDSSLFVPYAMHINIQLFEMSSKSFYKRCVKVCLLLSCKTHLLCPLFPYSWHI